MSHLRKLWLDTACKKPPMAQRLLEITIGLADDELARCQWALSLLVYLWQMAGPNHPATTPSLLLVHPGEVAPGVLDFFFAAAEHDPKGSGSRMVPEVDADYLFMIQSVQRQTALAVRGMHLPEVKGWDGARVKLFGDPYIETFRDGETEKLGVITTKDGFKTLSVTHEDDRMMLREALTTPPFLPFLRVGYDQRAARVFKCCPAFGHLPEKHWDRIMVEASVPAGQPLLFSPNGSPWALPEIHHHELGYLLCRMVLALRIEANMKLPAFDLLKRVRGVGPLESALRSRLRHFPGDYEYFILQTLRGLQTMARFVGNWVNHEGVSQKLHTVGTGTLSYDALRGLTLGVESLVYHGYGFHIPVEPRLMKGIMEWLRSHPEPVSKREILRKFPKLTAESRDELLEILLTEKLVKMEGKAVTAVSLTEFLSNLGSRLPPIVAVPTLIRSADR